MEMGMEQQQSLVTSQEIRQQFEQEMRELEVDISALERLLARKRRRMDRLIDMLERMEAR